MTPGVLRLHSDGLLCVIVFICFSFFLSVSVFFSLPVAGSLRLLFVKSSFGVSKCSTVSCHTHVLSSPFVCQHRGALINKL